MPRSPRKWTETEDRLLSEEVRAQLTDGKVKDWTAIASKISGRTNKDCRKRWHNALSGGHKKGYWTEQEDRLLAQAIQVHGETWTAVAEIVTTRSPDQCAKRWKQCLDPGLNRSKWTKEENLRLVELATIKGRRWKEIQMEHFPSRSRNAIKNQYTILMRRLSKTNKSEPKSALEICSGVTPGLPESPSEEIDMTDLDASGDDLDMRVEEMNRIDADRLDLTGDEEDQIQTRPDCKTDNKGENGSLLFSFDPQSTFTYPTSEFDPMIHDFYSDPGMYEPRILWGETGGQTQTTTTDPEIFNGNPHGSSRISPNLFPDPSCETELDHAEQDFYTGLLTPDFTDIPSFFSRDSEIPISQPPTLDSLDDYVAQGSPRKTKIILSVDEADHNTVELLVQAAFRSGCKFHLARE